MTDKKSTIWQEELRKHLDNATPTEDWRKSVEQDDRIIQFDAGEEVKASKEVLRASEKLINARAEEEIEFIKSLPDLLEEDKRSDRFFGMRLNKSTDDIENTFLVMFAEFVSLMAILIGVLGFGILLWAIFS
jgi:hypothetical protein